MVLNERIVAKINMAFDGDNAAYPSGYRDALESFALALQGTIPEGLLVDALESAMDAYANNFDNFFNDDPDFYQDFEDDGQPTEMQEWHDFDPDC